MAVKSYALTTRQRLKDWLGLTTTTDTQDNVLDRIIDSVTEFVENYIGFRVKLTSYTEEVSDTDNSGSLLLKRFPISTSASFYIDRRNSSLNENEWERIDSQYYHINYGSGIIKGAGGWKFFQTTQGYRVTYSAGFDFDNSTTFLSDTEGGDLELAAWMLASNIYNMRKNGGGVQSEKIGDYAVVYRRNVLENDELKSILDKYALTEPGGPATPFHY